MKALLALPLALSLLISSAAAQSGDVKGSSDHPILGRYEGAKIAVFESKAYEELRLPVKRLERGERNNPAAWQKEYAGKLTSILYEGPAGRSILEVMRNYEAALKRSGFEIAFFCRRDECSPGEIPTFWEAARAGIIRVPQAWDGLIYLLAQRNGAEGQVTVGLLGVETKASGNRPLTPFVAATIVEGKPMETDKISVIEAPELQQALTRDGRVAIYGIYFDFDKADLKPDSRPQIEQLGALLKANPQLSVVIVGHTDNQGAFDYNLALSQRRAQSLVSALTLTYAIPAARLTSSGAGMAAPVATNRTEDGRAKNRRVEIVER